MENSDFENGVESAHSIGEGKKSLKNITYLSAKNNGKMRDFYRVMDPALGTGAYGEVRKCYTIPSEDQRKKSSLKQFRAVKILSKAYMD
jgi:hypothetical protein